MPPRRRSHPLPGTFRPPTAAALGAALACACAASSRAPAWPCTAVDDGIACTADACDPVTGAVRHLPVDAACPAGEVCSPMSGCGPPAPTCDALPRVAGTSYAVRTVVTDLAAPVHVAAPPGDTERLFVVEQAGRVRLVLNGQLQPAPYLDLSSEITAGGERGLLSLAFHPDFAANGKLYLNFTDAAGDVVVSELSAPDPAGSSADPASEVRLLTIPHRTYANHNGGLVAFGPDGWLYVSVGDGGGGGDPLGSGQNPSSLLGKLLRIDPAAPASVVPGNPFGNAVYHYGLRNPWRFGFDRWTGDLYIGDVGQDLWEEIDFQAAAAPGQAPPAGTNWGWNVMEGSHCYGAATCDQTGLALPVYEYGHGEGRTVVGGHVYRGVVMPDLAAAGAYFFADTYGSVGSAGFVRTFRIAGGQVSDVRDVTATFATVPNIVSFGEDGCGELYAVSYSGSIAKLVPGP